MTELSRRDFLSRLGRTAVALGAAGPAFRALEALAAGAGGRRHGLKTTPPELWDALDGGAVRCRICPWGCELDPGDVSFCRGRTNIDGRLVSQGYGKPCILTVDPIEKLPLAHYRPGTENLSLAIGGCNLRCLYCQNWRESQSQPGDLRTFDVPPERAVTAARGKGLDTIGYTYTGAVASYEYCCDVAAAARDHGVHNVMASALYINPGPLRRLCAVMDAFTVTLKGFDEAFYRNVAGVELGPVLRSLEVVKAEGVWLEIVNLVVPTYNDDEASVRSMCRWIRENLGSTVPLHFGRFVPKHRLKNLPRTSVQSMEQCREIGLEAGLKHVYLFNLSPHEGNNTFCPRCGREVIRRLGFTVRKNELKKGRCPYCGGLVAGVWT